jgi:hypothetical protein
MHVRIVGEGCGGALWTWRSGGFYAPVLALSLLVTKALPSSGPGIWIYPQILF